MSYRSSRILATCSLALAIGFAPITAKELSVDGLFDQARESARSGDRDRARDLCSEILERSPGYSDVRVFLGRLHAWDREYDDARIVLRGVLRQEPEYADARLALVDVELWSDRPHEALSEAEKGLELSPSHRGLLERRAKSLADLGREQEALATAEDLLRLDPGRSSRKLYRGLLDKSLPNKFSADYDVENFNDDSLDDWEGSSFEYRRRTRIGGVLGRVNFARRFDDEGSQFEIDAYPKIHPKTYLFLNAGFSSTSLFPDLRYSAEVYHNFPHGYETSLGFRRLEFDSSDVTIYTGTLAKYFGNYWISFRPNYVDKTSGTSSSGGVTLRRFFGGRYEYAGLTIRSGSSKTDPAFVTDEEDRFASFSARAELRRRVTHRIILKGNAGYRVEELEINDENRRSVFVGFGVERHF